MRVLEKAFDHNDKLVKDLKGSTYIDFRHSEYEGILKDFDDMLKPHGLRLVVAEADGDGYMVKVEKK